MEKYLYILTLLIGACNNPNSSEQLLVIEGKGVSEIVLYKSTIEDVKEKFGNNYEVIKWREHSIEYKYQRIGISFTHKQNSNDKLISYIDIDPKSFEGTTTKDLKIQEDLKISDIIEIYGEPIWNYTLDSTELYAEYDGIEFRINPERDFTDKHFLIDPKRNINHSHKYENSKIQEISITL